MYSNVAWLIIQNTNAYEAGFTAAWDGFRGALWKNRTPDTEKPLMHFLEVDAIRSVYLHGHRKPELVSPDNWNMDFRFMERPKPAGSQMDLFYDYRTNVRSIRRGKRSCGAASRRRSSSGVSTTSSSLRKEAKRT